MSDYNDAIQRAQRLSVAREALLSQNNASTAISSIQKEDVEIYARWLVSHFYSQKTFQQSMKLIEWLPHEMNIDHMGSNESKEPTKPNLAFTSIGNKNAPSDPNQKINQLAFILNFKYKALDNMFLTSSNALAPRDELINSISYSKFKKFKL